MLEPENKNWAKKWTFGSEIARNRDKIYEKIIINGKINYLFLII